MRNRLKWGTGAVVLTVLTALLAGIGSTFLWLPDALASSADPVRALGSEVWKGGLWAAALATGLSSLGAGFAVGTLGAAAMGTLAEKPELFGRLIIFIGLAEGIAIYGLIVSILILNRLT